MLLTTGRYGASNFWLSFVKVNKIEHRQNTHRIIGGESPWMIPGLQVQQKHASGCCQVSIPSQLKSMYHLWSLTSNSHTLWNTVLADILSRWLLKCEVCICIHILYTIYIDTIRGLPVYSSARSSGHRQYASQTDLALSESKNRLTHQVETTRKCHTS